MIRLLAILLLAASQAFAADDPQKTIDALQAALQQSQAQTAQANQIQLQMAADRAAMIKELESLRKEVAELKKPKEPAK